MVSTWARRFSVFWILEASKACCHPPPGFPVAVMVITARPHYLMELGCLLAAFRGLLSENGWPVGLRISCRQGLDGYSRFGAM